MSNPWQTTVHPGPMQPTMENRYSPEFIQSWMQSQMLQNMMPQTPPTQQMSPNGFEMSGGHEINTPHLPPMLRGLSGIARKNMGEEGKGTINTGGRVFPNGVMEILNAIRGR